MTELNSLAIITLLKQTGLHVTKTGNGFTTDQGTCRFTANTAMNSFTNKNITSVKRLEKIEKIAGLVLLTIRAGFQRVLALTGLLVELTTMCFT